MTQLHQKTTVVNIHKGEAYDVYIGRPGRGISAEEAIWGNEFLIGRDGDRDTVIASYRQSLIANPALMAKLPTLKGKRLGCFCKPYACHGDVLAELADLAE